MFCSSMCGKEADGCVNAFSLPSSPAAVAFHGLQLKIKRELHSPCSELSSNCSQERPFKLQYGEKCPYVRWAKHGFHKG